MSVTVDFHVHTVHSPDSVITFAMLVEGCRRNGVDVVAVMDHDVIDGALEFEQRARDEREAGRPAPRVLVGEEVRTAQGEICGLCISEHVPRGLSAKETMLLIREQGGLVYVPHPFDLLKFKRLKAHELVELEPFIDIIEVFNGKPRFPGANMLARRFLADHRFPAGAGSDSHDPTHLGAAHVLMEEFEGPAELLAKLAGAKVEGKMYSPFSSAYRRVAIRRRAGRTGREGWPA